MCWVVNKRIYYPLRRQQLLHKDSQRFHEAAPRTLRNFVPTLSFFVA